jgi:phage terminase small subunit
MKEAFKKLEPATRKWITSLKKRYVLEDYRERLFILAGGAWDRAQQARRIIAKEGSIQTDRFGQKKAHPSIQIEALSMLNFAKLLRETGIDLERADDPRPPRQY